MDGLDLCPWGGVEETLLYHVPVALAGRVEDGILHEDDAWYADL